MCGSDEAACCLEIIKHGAAAPGAMGTNALVEGHQCSLIRTSEHGSAALQHKRGRNLLSRHHDTRGCIKWDFQITLRKHIYLYLFITANVEI